MGFIVKKFSSWGDINETTLLFERWHRAFKFSKFRHTLYAIECSTTSLSVKFTKFHKMLVPTINRLKVTNRKWGRATIRFLFCAKILGALFEIVLVYMMNFRKFLLRLLSIHFKIGGSKRCISIGNRYQSICSWLLSTSLIARDTTGPRSLLNWNCSNQCEKMNNF